jgi:hypothetical protein
VVSPEIHAGIKIRTNPADRDCRILGAKALKTGNWTDLVNGIAAVRSFAHKQIIGFP